MKVKDYMTHGVISTEKSTNIVQLAKIMKENDIGFIPITEGKKIVGVITDRDLITKIVSNNDTNILDSYLQKNIFWIEEEKSILNALEKMKEKKVKRLLVSHQDKITGILSLSDILPSDDPKILETITSIFKIIPNKRNSSAEIDEFYL